MSALTWITGIFLLLHVVQSNVLLTANLGDVNEMVGFAKQLSQSPVITKISEFVQRASDQFKKQFNEELNKATTIKRRRPKYKKYGAKLRSNPNEQEAQRRSQALLNEYRSQDSDDRPKQRVYEEVRSHDSHDRPKQRVYEEVRSQDSHDRPKQRVYEEVRSQDNDEGPKQRVYEELRSQENFGKKSYDESNRQREIEVKLDRGGDEKRYKKDSGDKSSQENKPRKDKVETPSDDVIEDDVAALGKNASYYLKSVRRLFENL